MIIKKSLLLFVAALLLAGCVDVEVNTNIEPGGSGIQKWQFTTTALLSSKLKRQVEESRFFTKRQARITDEFRQGDYILRVEMPFKKTSDLNDEDRTIAFERKGFFVRTFTYTETWKRSLAQAGFLDQSTSLIPVTMKVIINAPGRIIESNADQFQKGEARWNIALADLGAGKTLKVISKSWNLWTVLPALFLVLGALAAGIYLLLAAKKRSAIVVRTRCSNCEASVQQGSLYCNYCGAKM